MNRQLLLDLIAACLLAVIVVAAFTYEADPAPAAAPITTAQHGPACPAPDPTTDGGS